jgi:hypothetical protein
MMKPLFFSVFILITAGLFAAPLEGGFVRAPASTASQAEKEQAYVDARNRVINAAAKYEKVPYRYGGITKSGLDCSGFVYASFKDALGVSTPRSATGLYTWAEIITLEKAQPGDLLFFKTTGSSISHVAIYLGGRRFIHSASAGQNTGVIYSTLDEKYWSRAYAAAGRAFPETTGYHAVYASAEKPASSPAGGGDGGWSKPVSPPAKTSSIEGANRILFGVALAPTWNGFLKDGNLMRGMTSQFRIAADTDIFKTRMIFGFETRMEYDGALGVFRLPFTLSWGFDDRYRIFAGPVISFGDPSISVDDGERNYKGGTSWLGAIGITAAPFIFKSALGEIAPYVETAWQYYISDNESRNYNADISAGLRFSTGIRWTKRIR